MKPGKPLRADPAKVRAWQQRSRQHLADRALTPPRPTRRKTRIPPDIRARVMARSLGLCFHCLHHAGVDPARASLDTLQQLVQNGVLRRAVHLHHVLPERAYPEYAQEPRNLVGTAIDCHFQHEQPAVNDGRFQWAALPVEVRSWVLDRASEHAQIAAYVARTYRGAPSL